MRAFCLAVVCLTAVVTATGAAATFITYKQCTDPKLCDPASCTSATVPSNSCLPVGNSTSGYQSNRLNCDPVVRVCLLLLQYKDSKCGDLIGTTVFPCDRCDPHHNNRVLCESMNGKELVSVFGYPQPACQGNGRAFVNFTQGQCFENKPSPNSTGPIVWAKFAGSTLCTVVDQFFYTSKDCSGPVASHAMLPQDRCLDGAEVTCHYD